MSDNPRIVPLRTAETIENEAASWLAKLDRGNLSAADRAEFREWLSKSDDHERALKQLVSVWRDMDFLWDAGTNPINQSRRFRPVLRSRRWAAAIAVFLLTAVGVHLWVTDRLAGPEPVFHSTQVGAQKTQMLADGSTAHLNTNSLIEVELLPDIRIVRLIRGEAMFEVAHDSSRPFVVYAAESQIRAVGTAFVVRMDSDNIMITVVDGQVQLSKRAMPVGLAPKNEKPDPDAILLSQGEAAEIDNQHPTPNVIEVELADLDRQLAWLQGELVFNDERLENVVEEVNRYVPGSILIDDPDLRDVRVSGRFEIRDPDALLEAIQLSFNVRVDYHDSRVIRLYR
jgi:transmembrane sensor